MKQVVLSNKFLIASIMCLTFNLLLAPNSISHAKGVEVKTGTKKSKEISCYRNGVHVGYGSECPTGNSICAPNPCAK